MMMQMFGNINQTGLIDEETIKLMKRKRCGIADIIDMKKHRVKRYSLQGSKWPTTNLTWR